MLQGFKLFSEILGLQINEEKYDFYTVSVEDAIIQRIEDATVFKHNKLPV